MRKKRNRWGLLLIGMFLGIIVGVSIMWWASNFRQTNWISFQKVNHLIQKLIPGDDNKDKTIIISRGDNNQGKGKGNFSPLDTIPYDVYADSIGLIDSTDQILFYQDISSDYYIPEELLPDSLRWFGSSRSNRLHSDSISQDTISKTIQQKAEIIRRDQFLQSRILTIKGKSDTLSKNKAYLDSLLTDDKMTSRTGLNKLRVELWKSPVNYKGYKFSGNKLILFGIENFDKLTIEYINKKLYFRNINTYYLIEHTDDFRPFIPVKKPEQVINNS